MANEYPTTVDAAVRLLMALVEEAEQAKIAAMESNELYTLHFGWGVWIRNHMGLYAGNHQLLSATGETDPDDASMVIIRAFHDRLLAEQPKLH